MTAGSAVVAEGSPPVFGNLHTYDDTIVPWIRRMTDEVDERDAACMIQSSRLGRRTGSAHDDRLPVVAPSPVGEPARLREQAVTITNHRHGRVPTGPLVMVSVSGEPARDGR